MEKFWLLSFGAAAIAIGALALGYVGRDIGPCRDFNQASVQTPLTTISVAVPATDVEQKRGLSGCKEIPEGAGMYFPIESRSRAVFWMKGMIIPIDIIWIDGGQVSEVTANVPPPSGKRDEELIRYQPEFPVDGVLEVAAGQAVSLGLTPGARVQFIP